MKRPPPEDPDELRRRIAELRQRLLKGIRGSFFPPIAGVCVDLSYERLVGMGVEGKLPCNDDDIMGLYALAHESIHLAQAVTSRWFFAFVRELTRKAVWAAHLQAKRELPEGWLEGGRIAFRGLQATLTDQVDGFSALEVLETQAVIEGLWAAMPQPSPTAIVQAALKLHSEHPKYRHILEHMVDQVGEESAIHLGPKLCAIALQSDQPGGVLADMLSDLEKVKGDIGVLVNMSPEDLLRSRRLDPFAVSRSCREAGGIAPRDKADFWAQSIMVGYFDRYEALGSVRLRLSAMMHPGRREIYLTREDKPIFMPMYVLFGDGHCKDPLGSTRNVVDFARWVDIGLAITDGIELLSETS